MKLATRIHWLYCCATGLAALITTAEPVTPQSPRATPEEISRSVDSVAARMVASGVSPGLGVAIAMDGRTGPVEVFDAAKDQLRIEIAGTGNVVGFRFEGPGAARSLELTGETFVRR